MGLTDRTGELIEKISQVNPKVKPIHLKKNRGYGAAVAKGYYDVKTTRAERQSAFTPTANTHPKSFPAPLKPCASNRMISCKVPGSLRAPAFGRNALV